MARHRFPITFNFLKIVLCFLNVFFFLNKVSGGGDDAINHGGKILVRTGRLDSLIEIDTVATRIGATAVPPPIPAANTEILPHQVIEDPGMNNFIIKHVAPSTTSYEYNRLFALYNPYYDDVFEKGRKLPLEDLIVELLKRSSLQRAFPDELAFSELIRDKILDISPGKRRNIPPLTLLHENIGDIARLLTPEAMQNGHNVGYGSDGTSTLYLVKGLRATEITFSVNFDDSLTMKVRHMKNYHGLVGMSTRFTRPILHHLEAAYSPTTNEHYETMKLIEENKQEFTLPKEKTLKLFDVLRDGRREIQKLLCTTNDPLNPYNEINNSDKREKIYFQNVHKLATTEFGLKDWEPMRNMIAAAGIEPDRVLTRLDFIGEYGAETPAFGRYGKGSFIIGIDSLVEVHPDSQQKAQSAKQRFMDLLQKYKNPLKWKLGNSYCTNRRRRELQQLDEYNDFNDNTTTLIRDKRGLDCFWGKVGRFTKKNIRYFANGLSSTGFSVGMYGFSSGLGLGQLQVGLAYNNSKMVSSGAFLLSKETLELGLHTWIGSMKQTATTQMALRVVNVAGLITGSIVSAIFSADLIKEGQVMLACTNNTETQAAGLLKQIQGGVGFVMIALNTLAFFLAMTQPVLVIITSFLLNVGETIFGWQIAKAIARHMLEAAIIEEKRVVGALYPLVGSELDLFVRIRRDARFLLPDIHDSMRTENEVYIGPALKSMDNYMNNNTDIDLIMAPHRTHIPPTPICNFITCRENDLSYFNDINKVHGNGKTLGQECEVRNVTRNCEYYGPCSNSNKICKSEILDSYYGIGTKCKCDEKPAGYYVENRIYSQMERKTYKVHRLRANIINVQQLKNVPQSFVQKEVWTKNEIYNIVSEGYLSNGYLSLQSNKSLNSWPKNTVIFLDDGNDDIKLHDRKATNSIIYITGPGNKNINAGKGTTSLIITKEFSKGTLSGSLASAVNSTGSVILEPDAFPSQRIFVDLVQGLLATDGRNTLHSINNFKVHSTISAIIGRQGKGETFRISCSTFLNGKGGGSLGAMDFFSFWDGQNCSKLHPSTVHMHWFSRLDVHFGVTGSLGIHVNCKSQNNSEMNKDANKEKGYIHLALPHETSSTKFSSNTFLYHVSNLNNISFKRFPEKIKTDYHNSNVNQNYTSKAFQILLPSFNYAKVSNQDVINFEIKFPLDDNTTTVTTTNDHHSKYTIHFENEKHQRNISAFASMIVNLNGDDPNGEPPTFSHNISNNNNCDLYKGIHGFRNIYHISGTGSSVQVMGTDLHEDVFVFHDSEKVNDEVNSSEILLKLDGKGELKTNAFYRTREQGHVHTSNKISCKQIVTLDWLPNETNSKATPNVKNIHNVTGECLNLRFSLADTVNDIALLDSTVELMNIIMEQQQPQSHQQPPALSINVLNNVNVTLSKRQSISSSMNSRNVKLYYNNGAEYFEKCTQNQTFEETLTFANPIQDMIKSSTFIQINGKNFSQIHFKRKEGNENTIAASHTWSIIGVKGDGSSSSDSNNKGQCRFVLNVVIHGCTSEASCPFPKVAIALSSSSQIHIAKDMGSGSFFSVLAGSKSHVNEKGQTVGVFGLTNAVQLNSQLLANVEIGDALQNLPKGLDLGLVLEKGKKRETSSQQETESELPPESIKINIEQQEVVLDQNKRFKANMGFLQNVKEVIGRIGLRDHLTFTICSPITSVSLLGGRGKGKKEVDVITINNVNGIQNCPNYDNDQDDDSKNVFSSAKKGINIVVGKNTVINNRESNASFVYHMDSLYQPFRRIVTTSSHHYVFKFQLATQVDRVWVNREYNELNFIERATGKTLYFDLPSSTFPCAAAAKDINREPLSSLPVQFTFTKGHEINGQIYILRKCTYSDEKTKQLIESNNDDEDEDIIQMQILVGPMTPTSEPFIETIQGSKVNIITIDISNDEQSGNENHEAFGIICKPDAKNKVIFVQNKCSNSIHSLALQGSPLLQSELIISKECLYSKIIYKDRRLLDNEGRALVNNITGLQQLISQKSNPAQDEAFVDFNLRVVKNFGTVHLQPINDKDKTEEIAKVNHTNYPHQFRLQISLPIAGNVIFQESEHVKNPSKYKSVTFSNRINSIGIQFPEPRNIHFNIPSSCWKNLKLKYVFDFSLEWVDTLDYKENENRLYYIVNGTTYFVRIQKEYKPTISLTFSNGLYSVTIDNFSDEVILTKVASSYAAVLDMPLVPKDYAQLLHLRINADRLKTIIAQANENHVIHILPRQTMSNYNDKGINGTVFVAFPGKVSHFGGIMASEYLIMTSNLVLISTGFENKTFLNGILDKNKNNINLQSDDASKLRKWEQQTIANWGDGDENLSQIIDLSFIQEIEKLADSDLKIETSGKNHHLTITNKKRTTEKSLNVTVLCGCNYWVTPYLRIATHKAVYAIREINSQHLGLVKIGIRVAMDSAIEIIAAKIKSSNTKIVSIIEDIPDLEFSSVIFFRNSSLYVANVIFDAEDKADQYVIENIIGAVIRNFTSTTTSQPANSTPFPSIDIWMARDFKFRLKDNAVYLKSVNAPLQILDKAIFLDDPYAQNAIVNKLEHYIRKNAAK